MNRLQDLDKRVRALEADTPADAEAINHLVAEVLGSGWETPQAREAAQCLVVRLERLRWQLRGDTVQPAAAVAKCSANTGGAAPRARADGAAATTVPRRA